MKKPKISLVVTTFNSKNYLKATLNSLKNQTFQNYEFIILDDDSTDNTREIIKKVGLKFKKNEKRMGFVKNLNQGIKLAKGEYVAIIDHDMIYTRDYFEQILKSDGDVIGAKSYYPNSKIIRSFGAKVNFLTTKTIVFGKNELDKGQWDYLRKISAIGGGSMVVKKKVFDTIGFFDENYFMYFADIDFCYRAKNAGFKIRLSDAVCYHEKEKKTKLSEKQKRRILKDKLFFFKKYSNNFLITIIFIKFFFYVKEVLDRLNKK